MTAAPDTLTGALTMLTLETRALLAARYLSPTATGLTHTFRVDDGTPYASLCGVLASSAADVEATDPTAAPTCRKCLAQAKRLDLSCFVQGVAK